MGALRERKKAATRQALEEAALRLFLRRGFDDTTVDDIAAAAEVSRRTFFRYFETKESAVFARHGQRLEAFRELLVAREGEVPSAAVERACLTMAAHFMSDRDAMLSQQRVIESSRTLLAHDVRLDVGWEGAIAHALGDTDGTDAEERRRARILAGATLGMIRAILRDWFAKDGEMDLVERGRQAFQVLGLDRAFR